MFDPASKPVYHETGGVSDQATVMDWTGWIGAAEGGPHFVAEIMERNSQS
jgi:hypothetical protein